MGGRWIALGAAIACALLGAAPVGAAGRCGDHPWCDTSLSPERRAALLLAELTTDEKYSLMNGDDLAGVATGTPATGTSDGVPRLDVPTIYYSDGPVGTREGSATAMPAPIGLAAGFDSALARRAGITIADEVRKKGNDVVHAPTVDIMRTPFAGRTFEGYGEDPWLSSRLGGALDPGRAVAGRDRQREALRAQQPGGRPCRAPRRWRRRSAVASSSTPAWTRAPCARSTCRRSRPP